MTHFADKEHSGDAAGTRGLMHTTEGSGEVTVALAIDCEELVSRVPGFDFSIGPGRVAARVCFPHAEGGHE